MPTFGAGRCDEALLRLREVGRRGAPQQGSRAVPLLCLTGPL